MENWKSVVGYDGFFEVSDMGRVRSVARRVKNGDHSTKHMPSVVIKPNKHANGYYCVGLSAKASGKKYKTATVHRLVAGAFIGNGDGLQVNHKDEDKSNNKLSNLEYMTAKQNVNYGTSLKRRAMTQRKPIEQYDIQSGKTIREWNGIAEAEEAGYLQSAVSLCCSGHNKHHRGYGWRKKE